MTDSRVRLATTADLAAIDSLRRAEQEAVGFIPMSRYESEIEARRRTLFVMRENNDPVGFLFWTRGWPIGTVQQIVIRDDARRQERGAALIATAAEQMGAEGRKGITLRCRASLGAVDFWRALGFAVVRQEQGGRRGPLWRFYRPIQPSLLEPTDFVRGLGINGGPRSSFRTTRRAQRDMLAHGAQEGTR